jgi:uncharacterized membrane protein
MAMSNMSKSNFWILLGLIGLIFTIMMFVYVYFLLSNNNFSWYNFAHSHWTGVAGVIGFCVFILGVYLHTYYLDKAFETSELSKNTNL